MKRRNLMAAVVAAGVAATAGLYRFTDLFVKHYAPTPYDDLLVRLTDREQAAKLGAQLTGSFDLASQSTRLREIPHVPGMQEVEDTVREDDSLAGGPQRRYQVDRLGPGHFGGLNRTAGENVHRCRGL